MKCQKCGEKTTVYIFSIQNSEKSQEKCPECKGKLARSYSDTSIYGKVAGGTNGGAGMGLKERNEKKK